MTEQQLHEKLMQELQSSGVHGNFHPAGAPQQVPGRPPHQTSQASVLTGEQTLQQQNIMKKGYPGGLPDRMQAQQSQESFSPYEENRMKRHDLAGAQGGLSHPSSGKSNSSSVNTTQKMGGAGVPRAATSNNHGTGSNHPFPPHVGGSVEGVGGLLTQGSVANGLQYSQNYQQQAVQHLGQAAAPFRRKASNTNKQSLTHLKNSSLQHEDDTGTPEEAASTEALTRHMMPGFSSQGIDVKGSSN